LHEIEEEFGFVLNASERRVSEFCALFWVLADHSPDAQRGYAEVSCSVSSSKAAESLAQNYQPLAWILLLLLSLSFPFPFSFFFFVCIVFFVSAFRVCRESSFQDYRIALNVELVVSM
jgi:hypothetical protein